MVFCVGGLSGLHSQPRTSRTPVLQVRKPGRCLLAVSMVRLRGRAEIQIRGCPDKAIGRGRCPADASLRSVKCETMCLSLNLSSNSYVK